MFRAFKKISLVCGLLVIFFTSNNQLYGLQSFDKFNSPSKIASRILSQNDGFLTEKKIGNSLSLSRVNHKLSYDSTSGIPVWLSPDPIGEEGGINLYAYVLNDPLNMWDPLGLIMGPSQETLDNAHSIDFDDIVDAACDIWEGLDGLPTSRGIKAGLSGGAKAASYSFGALRTAYRAVLSKLGVKNLKKGKPSNVGNSKSPQRGNSKKGCRLDSEGHPKTKNPNEKGPHINYWDYTKAKRKAGGTKDAVPIK